MLKNISLTNFKGITDKVSISLSNITLLFGLNNVGKSSIVQSLDLFANLSDKFELPIVTEYKNYGSIKSIINNRQIKKPAKIELEFNDQTSPNKIEYLFSDLSSEISFYDHELGDYVFEKSIEFSNNGYAFINKINTDKKSYTQLESLAFAYIKKDKTTFKEIADLIEHLKILKYHEYILSKIVSKDQSYLRIDVPSDKTTIVKIFDNINLVVHEIAAKFIEQYKSKLTQEGSASFNVTYNITFKQFINNNKNLIIDILNENYKNLDINDPLIFNYICLLLRSKIYENIFIRPIERKENNLNPRLKQRFRRFNDFEIQSDPEMREVMINLNNILKFCSLVNSKETKARDKNIKKFIYQNIVEFKFDLAKIDVGTDNNINLLKILQDLYFIDSSSSNLSRFSSSSYTYSYQIRNELSQLKRKIPRIKILNNNFEDKRIFTYKNDGSFIDQLFINYDNQEFKDYIISSLNKLGFEIDGFDLWITENNFSIRIEKGKKTVRTSVNLDDCGRGMKNILAVLIQLYNIRNYQSSSNVSRNFTNKNDITCVEEPEANLHPKFQAELGELIAEHSKKNQGQLIIETHSQNLTLRLLKLVRNGKLNKNQIAFNCLYRNSRGFISVFSPEILEDGNFTGSWPGGFFDEDLYELND